MFLCRIVYMAFAMFDVLHDARWLPGLSTLNIVSDSNGLGSENLKRGLITSSPHHVHLLVTIIGHRGLLRSATLRI